ncbi:hypothetical protein PAAG_01341 [Paracoccidioides lutzii Pb01]|uniref:Major facilitator superfamily (MFS) profile domain-containing protein n=1 Tax=Paracoccidioides lutzii (strain ATCC MYA-826 / Pb01) TaxID=502779 RepID=C1GS46_PARBA|nr:hypothetical protein PAAG_01341 [Paracoccidioides lutzii Pb01]EEH38879.1 hypothetical protein PAAG_01341 [Paracoccidioides lutzii Pb01]
MISDSFPAEKSPGEGSRVQNQAAEISDNEAIDPKKESRLLRKIDIHLLLPLWVIFLFGFLDRINLGNVAVLGIVEELKLKGNDFNIALQIFFVPYIILDIPSNIVLKNFAPSTWISLLTFFWGIAAMCQGFVKNDAGLIACRFFIGVFEAGYVPGCAYLMAMFYKRHEFQKRFSIFWVAGLVAGAFGGLLAYSLNHMQGRGGYSGWRWIFIIEGLISVILAVPAKLFLTDWPDKAIFLTEEEKALLHKRHSEDVGGFARMDRLDSTAWKRILTDWKTLVASLIYVGITVSGYATALFIPSIVNSLGYSGLQSQIQSIPVWATSAATTVIVSYFTDRLRYRYGFIMFGVMFASIGYIILICQGPLKGGLPLGVRYMAVFFVTTGCYIVQPVTIVWLVNNLGGHYKRAVGLAIQVGFGNLGGIIASNVFVRKQAPRYFVGYGVALSMVIFCGIMSTVFALGLVRENRIRERGERDARLGSEELENMGDDDPRFRFSL